MALQNYREANKFLTIATKLFSSVDLKQRSKKIYEKIQSNFEKLNTEDSRRKMKKNLICYLFSMPLTLNKKSISDIFEQDLDRNLALFNKMKLLIEQERIFDDIKMMPLKESTFENLKNDT